MLFLTVPKDTPFSTQRVTLDGEDFILALEWNMRGGWYFGLATGDGEKICDLRKMTPDWGLLQFDTHPRRPKGDLVALDEGGRGRKPGYTSFGATHSLVYLEAADL